VQEENVKVQEECRLEGIGPKRIKLESYFCCEQRACISGAAMLV